jgi:DNA (cytosine-5)-methyltransferase 1
MTDQLTAIDLFSGIGGFSLGMEAAGIETIAFCEIDPFCRKVLKKHWPDVPIYDDIKKLDEETLSNTNGAGFASQRNGTDGIRAQKNQGRQKQPQSEFSGLCEPTNTRITPIHADIITGGFPCQPFSTAGKRRGEKDDRHLWPEMLRIIKIVRPTWIVAENVAGHISMGLDQVLSDLASEGYGREVFVLPACSKDAFHRRDRVWIIGKQDVVDSKRNEHNREIGGGFEEEGENEEQERKENSAARKSSGTSEVRLSDNRHEGSETVGNSAKQGLQDGRGRQMGGSKQIQKPERSGASSKPITSNPEGSETVADTNNTKTARQREHGRKIYGKPESTGLDGCCSERRWPIEPNVGRVANGIPRWLDEPDIPRVRTGVKDRVNRLRGLGNAVVPQVVAEIMKCIVEIGNA